MSYEDSLKNGMEYRFLGPTGIKVSAIGFGNWVNSNTEEVKKMTYACVKRAYELGINYFDTAEVYGYGEAEVQMGEALKKLNVPRQNLVVSTKLYWGIKDNAVPNMNGLSRKHIIEGTKNSLKRLQLEYVDIIFCHRPDYETPMQQICRAFDWVVRKGYTFYWGTSQWNAEDIAQAHAVCDKYGLIKPVVEQPEYNLFNRQKVEFKYRHLFANKLLGTTVFSPLASGILTGKYNDGIPEGSRFDKNPDLKRILDRRYNEEQKPKTIASLKKFKELADQLGCTMSQLAMAWVLNNPDVSCALTGASKVEQLEDTVKAVQIRHKLTNQIQLRIQDIFRTEPAGKLDMPKGVVHKSRRFKLLGYKAHQVSDGSTPNH